MASSSQEKSLNPNSSIVHQFIISGSEEHEYPVTAAAMAATGFGSDGRNRNLSLPQSSSLRMLPSMQSLGNRFSTSVQLFQHLSMSEDSQSCNNRHLINLLEAANERDYKGQRLSLSLGSYYPSNMLLPPHPHLGHIRDDASSTSQNQSCCTSYEAESFATVVGSSRYLKAAQALLEEVVSLVGSNAVDLSSYESVIQSQSRRKGFRASPELRAAESYTEFPSVRDHEIQTKITKLNALLAEIESKYEKYCHQMEQVVSPFEMVAGSGAARGYTAQALQAMSRHFCSLRDAIITQIKIFKRKLPHDLRACSGHNGFSLQQLGMIQTRQVWRQSRGLPENSVGILRSWLFEHFLHPYPNDSEKLILASQTGLSKNQISNWFINARVRLWKPMIEEMYKEEFADSSTDSAQPENTSTTCENLSNHGGK